MEEELAIAVLMELVSAGDWVAGAAVTRDQARLYCAGVRDHRIADVTLQAVALARSVGRHMDRSEV